MSFDVAREEGEHIISWCLNLRGRQDIDFDTSDATKLVWNGIAKPEEMLIEEHFHYERDTVEDGLSVFEVMSKLKEKYPERKLDPKKLIEAIKNKGYTKKGELFLGMKWRESRETVVKQWSK